MCSSVLGTEVTQPDRSSVTSVLGQFGPQKRTEVTEDRSGCRPCRRASVCLCLSQIDVLLKRLNAGSCSQCQAVAQGL